MVPNESDFSAKAFLQIVTDNLLGSVVLKRQLEEYFLSKTEELAEKCSKLELENRKLKDENDQLKQKLSKYESASTVCQSTNSQQILEQLHQQVSSTINELVVQINTNRTAWDAELLKYNEDYEKCKEDLQKLNLKISNDAFDKKFKEYRKTCEKNDLNRKETFKMLYEIDMLSKEKLEKEKEHSLKYLKEIELFVKTEKDKLNKIREVVVNYELNKEKKFYEDALHHGKQVTALYSNLLTNSGNKDKNESVIPTEKASPKANAKVESSSDERSIIALNFPGDSLPEVLDFLNNYSTELNLKREDIEITKTFSGRTYSNLTKITLPSMEFVNKILKGENTIKADFKGISISLYGHIKDHK